MIHEYKNEKTQFEWILHCTHALGHERQVALVAERVFAKVNLLLPLALAGGLGRGLGAAIVAVVVDVDRRLSGSRRWLSEMRCANGAW